jgi:hypothetical protein
MTDAFMPDVASMAQRAGMRDARCLMHAATLPRSKKAVGRGGVGRGEGGRGPREIESGIRIDMRVPLTREDVRLSASWTGAERAVVSRTEIGAILGLNRPPPLSISRPPLAGRGRGTGRGGWRGWEESGTELRPASSRQMRCRCLDAVRPRQLRSRDEHERQLEEPNDRDYYFIRFAEADREAHVQTRGLRGFRLRFDRKVARVRARWIRYRSREKSEISISVLGPSNARARETKRERARERERERERERVIVSVKFLRGRNNAASSNGEFMARSQRANGPR